MDTLPASWVATMTAVCPANQIVRQQFNSMIARILVQRSLSLPASSGDEEGPPTLRWLSGMRQKGKSSSQTLPTGATERCIRRPQPSSSSKGWSKAPKSRTHDT